MYDFFYVFGNLCHLTENLYLLISSNQKQIWNCIRYL